MQTLGPASNCCDSCDDAVVTQVPGPAGSDGADGSNGSAGENAFTTVATGFAVPDIAAPLSVHVVDSSWAVIGQKVFVETAGTFTVSAKVDGTHMTLTNTDYTGNAPDGTAVAIGAQIGPGGQKGADGAGAGNAFLIANNLSEGVAATIRANIAAVPTGLATGSGLTVSATDKILGRSSAGAGAVEEITCTAAGRALLDDANAAAQRVTLALSPGVNVQAYDAFLGSIATLGTAADKMLYTTGVDAAAETPITAVGRAILDDATVAAQRITLGRVGMRYGLICSGAAVDVNAVADTALTTESGRYRIDKVTCENSSVNLTTAQLGLFTAAGGAGTTIVAAQTATELTATTKFHDLTLEAIASTDIFTASTLYFRCAVAQGAAATLNVWIFGWMYD